MDRRKFLGGGCWCLWCASTASAKTVGTGCVIDGASLDAQRRIPATWADPMEALIPISGIPDFDKALGRQLVRLATTFGVRPGFAYADDWNGRNAYASPQTRMPNTRGTVGFGFRLLRHLLSLGAGGDMAVLGVCAHEFAHVHQFFSGHFRTLSALHPTAKLVELHADYLSGYFMGRLQRDRPAVRLRVYGEYVYSTGSYDHWDPEFHGTPVERLRAAEEGYQRRAEDRFSAASNAGREFVLQQFR